MNDGISYVFIAAAFFVGGLYIGHDSGREVACESVNLEWVKDKCMKVTRENVK